MCVRVSHPNSFGNNWQAYLVMCNVSKDETSERSPKVSTDTIFQDLCVAHQLPNSSSVIFVCQKGVGAKINISVC